VSAALHAEWTKLRTSPGTASARCPAAGCGQDPSKISFTGVDLGQAAVAIVAVLAVSAEYSTGMIRTTLAAMPGRIKLLAAKAAVVSVLILAAGALAAAGSLLTGWLILPGHGFTRAHGFAPLTLADGPVLRATAGSVLYLALIGLLSLGAAAAVRDSAVAIGLVLGVLYLLPIVAAVVSNATVRRHLLQAAPMTAGLDIQATTGLRSLPLSPWQGLAVLAAWAAGALLAGGLLLRLRDA